MRPLRSIQYGFRYSTQRLLSTILGKFNLFVLTFLATSGCRIEQAASPVATRSTINAFEVSDITPQRHLMSQNLKIGTHIETLIPSQPTSLAGFGGIKRRFLLPNPDQVGSAYTYFLPYEKVDSYPRIKTILMEGNDDEGKKSSLIIISLDLVAVTSEMLSKIVTELQLISPEREFSAANVHLVATHTHSGPGGLSEHPLWSIFASDRFDPSLFDEFLEKVKYSYKSALASLKTVSKITHSGGSLDGFNHTRFKGMDVDKQQDLLQFYDSDSSSPFLCTQFFSVHPTYFGQSDRTLSADVAGHIEQAFTNHFSGTPSIFFNTSVGNAEYDNLKDLGIYANSFVDSVSDKTRFVPQDLSKVVAFASTTISVPSPRVNFKACDLESLEPFVSLKVLDALPRKIKISYFSIGDQVFIMWPGEALFNATQQLKVAIKKLVPQVKHISILSNANDYLAYFTSGADYNSTQLESCSSLYGPNMVDTLVNASTELIKKFGP